MPGYGNRRHAGGGGWHKANRVFPIRRTYGLTLMRALCAQKNIRPLFFGRPHRRWRHGLEKRLKKDFPV